MTKYETIFLPFDLSLFTYCILFMKKVRNFELKRKKTLRPSVLRSVRHEIIINSNRQDRTCDMKQLEIY